MAKTDVMERYHEIVAEFEHQENPGRTADDERRGSPRVPVVCADVTVTGVHAVSPVDFSATGACFYSERPFRVGSEISLSVASVFSVPATVVHCAMVETDAAFLETRYCVRCHFADEVQGMEMLVLAKERETLT